MDYTDSTEFDTGIGGIKIMDQYARPCVSTDDKNNTAKYIAWTTSTNNQLTVEFCARNRLMGIYALVAGQLLVPDLIQKPLRGYGFGSFQWKSQCS